jgi:2-phosphosulfolactate phosphatase
VFDDQAEFEQRFDWGEAGVRRLAPHSDVVVIVDVLSFSTAVDIAVGCGATVYPYQWRDEGATTYARELDAVLAGSRQAAKSGVPYSLSPHSLLTIPAGSRLVLPSPNGATLSLLAAELGATVLTGCLRNASAVGAACLSVGYTVAVIAAGERWGDAGKPSESVRFAVEDLVGAGSILEALTPANSSPEAAAAFAAFRAARPALGQFLAECSSGKELRQLGFGADVTLAAQADVSQTAPHLVGMAFRSDARS